jgi:hypothetical protein
MDRRYVCKFITYNTKRTTYIWLNNSTPKSFFNEFRTSGRVKQKSAIAPSTPSTSSGQAGITRPVNYLTGLSFFVPPLPAKFK